MLNEELVRKLAHGDKETFEAISKLPTSLKMAYGMASDELRRKDNIVPVNSEMSFYVQKKTTKAEQEALGEALKNRLETEKRNEAEQQRIRQEHLDKVAKQRAERARALGSWQ